jgi:fucose 4-O-acetylase-like acetyltransferase
MLVDRDREAWPDAVKIVACILVVLGHFSQSMVKSDILPADSLYAWFQMTIYTFHVPLFFICSGYLYQSFTRMTTASDWWFNVRKKLLVLGVPYFVFTGVTLAMKAVAGDAANTTAEASALETLFLNPTAPYWYLYALFFMFLMTPVVRSKRGIALTTAVACGAKVISLSGITENLLLPYFASTLLTNEIWFVAGMGIAWLGLQEKLGQREAFFGLLFLPLSVVVYVWQLGAVAEFCIGMLASLCVISFSVWIGPKVAESGAFSLLRDETMPVYLMHTLFAAPIRIVLLRVGVTAIAPHAVLGLFGSFAGPSFAMWIMERLKPLDFFVYPSRYINLKRRA